MKKIWLILLPLLLSGCIWPFNQNPIIKHPKAPMLIMEGKVKIAVYYKNQNKLIEYGWVDAKGFTMRDFDWESYIAKIKAKRKAEEN